MIVERRPPRQVVLIVAILLAVTIIDVACGHNQREIDRQREQRQETVDNLIPALIYTVDPRTGVCYAYFWGGEERGGPALATVPCESVEALLLKPRDSR